MKAAPAIRLTIVLAMSVAFGDCSSAQSEPVPGAPAIREGVAPVGRTPPAAGFPPPIFNYGTGDSGNAQPVVAPELPPQPSPEIVRGFYDDTTVTHFPAAGKGKPVSVVTEDTDAAETDTDSIGRRPRDAYRLHDQAPFIYESNAMFLSAAPRLQHDFTWIWLEGYDAGTRSHTHTWPNVALFRIPRSQFLDGTETDWKQFLKSWGDEDWGRVRKVMEPSLLNEQNRQPFYGNYFEEIDMMAWPIRHRSSTVGAANSRQWNDRCRCDLSALDPTTVEVYVVSQDLPAEEPTRRPGATLDRYVGKFEAVRYKSDFGNPIWQGEWQLAQTVPMPFCGPFVAVRRTDRLYIVPSQGRVRSIEIVDDEARKPPVAAREVPSAESLDPVKKEAVPADPVKLVLIGNDPDAPVYAFTERQWYEVKDPIEYRPFDLGDVDESDPLPALVRAVREVRKPAVPNKADPAGAKQ